MVAITDITTGVVAGTGYFDKLMAGINAQIDEQFSNHRIQKADYATVYLGALQSAMAQAIQFASVTEQVAASQAKTVSETALLDQKTLTEQAQILDTVAGNPVLGAIGKLKLLHTAQTDGFARDAEQKASKILLDSWNISRSVVGAAYPVPSGALNTDIEDVLEKLRTGIAITQSIFEGVADAGADQTVAIGAFVQLDATASTYRTDGASGSVAPSGYTWTKLSGPAMVFVDTVTETSNLDKPTIAALAVGVYVFQLEAKYIGSVPTTSSFDTITVTSE